MPSNQAQTISTKVFLESALGFRPFFLLATISAFALILVWVAHFSGQSFLLTNNYYGTIVWHAHEMLYGYGLAVIAGFLLTAARNWTQQDTATGKLLLALVLLWLTGRMLPFFSNSIPAAIIAAIDIAFAPALAIVLARPIIAVKQRRNYIFIYILLAITASNIFFHLQPLGLLENSVVIASKLTLMLILLILVIMGCRVIPFFTEKGIGGGFTIDRNPRLDKLAEISIILFGICYSFSLYMVLVAITALFALIINSSRLYSWYNHAIWKTPLIWVLHIGYFWLILGLVLVFCSTFLSIPSSAPLHAFTTGCLGVMTMGMMARVALGHSGRPLATHSIVNIAFVLLNTAALFRVFFPLLLPEKYALAINISGSCWALAFGLFLIVYFRILTLPRIDGLRG